MKLLLGNNLLHSYLLLGLPSELNNFSVFPFIPSPFSPHASFIPAKMADEKQLPIPRERELSHELAASGDAVVVDNVGTDADRNDMYRMGKVQQMQVSFPHQCSIGAHTCVSIWLTGSANVPTLPNVQLQHDSHGIVGDCLGRFRYLTVQVSLHQKLSLCISLLL